MAQDFGLMSGVAGGVMVGLSIVALITVANVIWSYIPIGGDGQTLTDWASSISGVE